MNQLDELRRREVERLLPAMDAWNEAKKNLKAAKALAKLREKEYRQLSEDIRQRLEAMQVVLGMVQELESPAQAQPAWPQQEVRSIAEAPTQTSLLRSSLQ